MRPELRPLARPTTVASEMVASKIHLSRSKPVLRRPPATTKYQAASAPAAGGRFARFGKTKPNRSVTLVAVMIAAAAPHPRYSGVSHLPNLTEKLMSYDLDQFIADC